MRPTSKFKTIPILLLVVMAMLLPASRLQAAGQNLGSRSYVLYSTSGTAGSVISDSFNQDALMTLIMAANGGQINGDKKIRTYMHYFDLDRDGTNDFQASKTLIKRLSTCSIKGSCTIRIASTSSSLTWFRNSSYYGSYNYYSALTFHFGVDLSKETLYVPGKTYSGTSITSGEKVSAAGYTCSTLGSGVTVDFYSTARTLSRNTDYTAVYKNNTNAGTASVTVTGLYSSSYHYFGELTRTFTISPAPISEAVITVPDVTWPVTASTPAVVFNGSSLKRNTDYVVTHITSASEEHSVKLTGKGNFTGTVTKTYKVLPADISTCTVEVKSQTFTGQAIEPDITVKSASGSILVKDKDYTAAFKDNINAGTAAFTVTGVGHYTGSLSGQFAILRKSVAGAFIQFPEAIYNGKEQTPIPTVTLDGVALQKVTEFHVDYGEGCVSAGEYTLKIIGQGNYKASEKGSFTILPASLSAADVKVSAMTYTGKELIPEVTVKIGDTVLKNGTDYTADYYNNTNVGTGVVILTGTGNYKDPLTGTFPISPRSLAGAKVTAAAQSYTGKELTPDPVVTLDGTTLKAGTDYTVSYSQNIEVGTANVTVAGTGNYQGTASGTFAITQSTVPAETPAESETPKAPESPGTSAPAETPAAPETTESSETPETSAPAETSAVVYAADAITPEKPAVLAKEESKIFSVTDDTKDIKGSTYALLMAKGVSKAAKSIKITWKKVPGATKYIIYGNRCGKGKKYLKLATLKKTKTSWTKKKLKKGTYYKVMVVAVRGKKVLATSKTIHVATLGGKKGNPTGVSLTKKKKTVKTLTLRKGKSKTITATVKTGSLPVNTHRKVAWESSDLSVAKVNSKGKITAVGPGTCTIYAYAQNGVYASLQVHVK